MSAETSRQRWPEPEIDFSTFPGKDGKPMADNERNQREMIDTMFALRQPLEPLGHHVGGNLIIYYNPENGLDHLSPDVFVALDRDAGLRESWKTWLEGKFPEVVVEIASPSTQQRDLGEKLARYGALGAREYYIHDPARRLQPAFRGYRSAGGALVPVPNPSGASIRSGVLGLELRVVDGWLRVIDPANGEPYPTPDEVRDLQRKAERAQRQAERARRQAELGRNQAERAQREAELGRGQAHGIAHSMVLKVVALRFGGVPSDLAERLAVVTVPGQLELLADAALTAASLDTFLQLVDGMDHP